MSVPGEASPVYRLYQWAWAGLDWLYPPTCGGCGQRGTRWCPDCSTKTLLITPPICIKCGQELHSGLHRGDTCARCQSSAPPYQAMRSWALFAGPVRHALHQLKYAGDIALGEVLSRPMIQLLKSLDWQIDLVAPVPASLARQARRGYNQAALLARPLALGSGIHYQPHALSKVRETRSQVGLSLYERRENVAQAFRANPRFVAGKSVLIIDDVTTSGATLESCARGLLQAGCLQVYGLTLAHA